MGEIFKILSEIQAELKAPKSQYNSFGKYNYRSLEDIQTAVKPLLKKHNAVVTLSDEIVAMGNRFYVLATATLHVGEESINVQALAREQETKKGMDESQITGSASSYARKYAMNGLFAIDDTKDADTMDNSNGTQQNNKTNHLPNKPKDKKPTTEKPKSKKIEDKTLDELRTHYYALMGDASKNSGGISADELKVYIKECYPEREYDKNKRQLYIDLLKGYKTAIEKYVTNMGAKTDTGTDTNTAVESGGSGAPRQQNIGFK